MSVQIKRRLQRVDREGSPFFMYRLPSIPVNGFLAIEYSDISPEAPKYFPMDFIEVINNSREPIDIELTPAQRFLCPPGVIKKISNRAITMLRIWNMGTLAIPALTITINVSRLPLTEDEALRRGIPE